MRPWTTQDFKTTIFLFKRFAKERYTKRPLFHNSIWRFKKGLMNFFLGRVASINVNYEQRGINVSTAIPDGRGHTCSWPAASVLSRENVGNEGIEISTRHVIRYRHGTYCTRFDHSWKRNIPSDVTGTMIRTQNTFSTKKKMWCKRRNGTTLRKKEQSKWTPLIRT